VCAVFASHVCDSFNRQSALHVNITVLVVRPAPTDVGLNMNSFNSFFLWV